MLKIGSRYLEALKMELQRTHFRAMVFYDLKSGLNQQQSHSRLQAAFGDEAPSGQQFMTGLPKFEGGGAPWKMTPCSGRPAEATTSVQVTAVQRLVEEDGRLTVLQIAEEVGISSGSVSSILNKTLGLSKVSAG